MSNDLSLTDFRMAGFLVARGFSLSGTEVNRRGEVVFLFDNANGEVKKMLTSYPNSDECRYDSACRTMHDLVKVLKQQKR